MSDNNKFSLNPSARPRRVPAPKTPDFPAPDFPGPFSRSGHQLPPEAVSGAIRIGEFLTKARARCAEIQAMSDREIRQLDKLIEACQKDTEKKIQLLENQGKQKDLDLERIIAFGEYLEKANLSDAVKISLIDAFRDSPKDKR